jgi:hypothetical protein
MSEPCFNVKNFYPRPNKGVFYEADLVYKGSEEKVITVFCVKTKREDKPNGYLAYGFMIEDDDVIELDGWTFNQANWATALYCKENGIK